MFGAIARVAKSLVTAGVLANVRAFAGMRSEVYFQVLQPRESFIAAVELRWWCEQPDSDQMHTPEQRESAEN